MTPSTRTGRALQALLEALEIPWSRSPTSRNASQCGAPDLVVTRKRDGLVLGHVEAKDVGVSLDEAAKTEQVKKRYLPALPNFLLTDYLEFRWFVEGQLRDKFVLGEAKPNGAVVPDAGAQGHAEKVLKEFLGREPVRIEGAEELARRLARLTHLIRDGIVAAFQTGNASELLTGLARGLRADAAAGTGGGGTGGGVRRHVRADADLRAVLGAGAGRA